MTNFTLGTDSSVGVSERIAFDMGVQEHFGILMLEGDSIVIVNF